MKALLSQSGAWTIYSSASALAFLSCESSRCLRMKLLSPNGIVSIDSEVLLRKGAGLR